MLSPNMAVFDIEGHKEQYTLKTAVLSGRFEIEPTWRDLDYANGGSAVSLSAGFEIDPRGGHGLINQFDYDALGLSLEINTTTWDFDTDKVKRIGDIPLFPDLETLQNRALEEEICEHSTLWLPSMPRRADISTIAFGAVQDGKIDLTVRASSIYAQNTHDRRTDTYSSIEHTMGFAVKAQAVFKGITVEARGRVMENFDLDHNMEQARACFASLYPADQFAASVQVLQEAEGDVALTFTPRL